MIPTRTKFKLFALATKYGIEIVSYTPGNVLVHIATWQKNKSIFLNLIEELTQDPHIIAITFHEGTVNIIYDHAAFTEPTKIEQLLRLIDNYQL